jgi:hypothetical protein
MTHVADALEIFETGVQFTSDNRLDMPSKRRLAQEDPSWGALLDVPPPKGKQASSNGASQKQDRKKRARKK